MPEFMDVHRNMKAITPEDLLKAHQGAGLGRPGDRHRLLPFGGSQQGRGDAHHERAGHPTDEVYEITATA